MAQHSLVLINGMQNEKVAESVDTELVLMDADSAKGFTTTGAMPGVVEWDGAAARIWIFVYDCLIMAD